MLQRSMIVLLSVLPSVAVAGDTTTFEGLVQARQAEPLFWFAPPEWTSWQRRIADVGVSTFFPGADLADALLDEAAARDEVTGGRRKQPYRLAPGPGASRKAIAPRARVGRIVRMLTPRVKIRVAPRFAGIADAPAPGRTAPPVLRPVR